MAGNVLGMDMSRLCVLLTSRNLIGSDAAIVLTCFEHLYEAGSFLFTTSANGSIGMSALLFFFFRQPLIAAAVLILFAVTAGFAEWAPDLSRDRRAWLFTGQAVLLIMEQVGALYFVVGQHYADTLNGVPLVYRPSNFIFCDQMCRIGMPVWYVSAILARVREQK